MKASLILRRSPYSTVDAAEAVRHALGGLTNDVDVTLILLDDGAFAAIKTQDVAGTPYQSLSEGITDCIDMGAEVVVDEASLAECCMGIENLVPGVKTTDSAGVARIVGESSLTMIF